MKQTAQWKKEFADRFEARFDELKWLYCEVYNNDMQAFYWLTGAMYDYYQKRGMSITLPTTSRASGRRSTISRRAASIICT